MDCTIFNIQRYSLHDGEGIRSLVFFKGCPLRCEWCSNPESQEFDVQVQFQENLCMGCEACVTQCPQKARKVPGLDRSGCVRCWTCAELCPTGAVSTVGKRMPTGAIVEEALRDMAFYESSNGGVTLSGGEVLSQAEAAAELVDAFHRQLISVAVETSGFAPWEKARQVLEKADLVLYDLKHMDPAQHKRFTGVDNKIILENAKRLAATSADRIIFRIPLIGNVNATAENIDALGSFAVENHVSEVDFLPYHKYGQGKYEKIGRKYGCDTYYTPTDEEIAPLQQILVDKGLRVVIGG